MKYIFSAIFTFTFSISCIQAQQNHFIYLETEDKQPFYVKLDNKVLSSSAAGYLIIPKLPDGIYALGIGFPLIEGQQVFNCVINKKDIGYLIKNTGDKGWQLVDLQTQKAIVPGEIIGKTNVVVPVQEKENDAFSTMLASAVHDSTILQKDDKEYTVQKNEVLKDVLIPEKKEELQSDSVQKEEQPISIVSQQSIITKQLQNKSKDGIEMMFVDEYKDVKDTIRIFIPADKETGKTEQEVKIDTIVAIQTDAESKEPIKIIEHKLDTTMLLPQNVEEENKNEKVKKEPVFIELKMINSDCKNFANDDDFFKIRKKMVAENNDEEMIKAAKKFFKTKCFTTEQIKNLSVLFLKDEGKFMFFAASYPFVSNSDVFNMLASQLTESEYITRFKAMINK